MLSSYPRDSRCTRTSLRRGIGARPEDRPAVPRDVHAVRTEGSAELVVGFCTGRAAWPRDARRSSRRSRPIGENSDYQISTPSPRLIDPNESLPRRGRGPAHAEAWRGDGVVSACMLVASPCLALAAAASATALTRTCCVSAAPWARAARVARPAAVSGFVRRRPRRRRRARLSEAGRAVLKSVLSDAHWSRTFVVASHKLLCSPSGRLFRADGVANDPNKK